MKKRLAVIGCGIAAVPILKKAKELGIETHTIAKEETPSAKGLSDYFYPINFFDINKSYDALLKISPDGIIATSEITTEVTAVLAEKLNLIGNSLENGFAPRNKLLMRRCLDGSKTVFQPEYFIYGEKEVKHYPVVVKAIDSCGKNGISFAQNKDELEAAVNYARLASKDVILIEQYIKGVEYSLECLSFKGRHHVIQITKKDSSGPMHFAELGHHQPACLDEKIKTALEKAADEILSRLGILNSMSHLEIKVLKNGRICFIEAGARAGGDFIADELLYLSCDYDYYKGAIQIALGDFKEPEVHNTACSGVYFLCSQTKAMLPMFEAAKGASWCYRLKMPQNALCEKNSNSSAEGGYLIYKSEKKIVMSSFYKAERINERPDAFKLIYDFNKAIGREIDKNELCEGIEKFINVGNVFCVLHQNEIIAFLNVYCNNEETKEAYINNVEVKRAYRGQGLSKLILEAAIELCRKNAFETIALHVAVDNDVAINLYKKYGFEETGNLKEQNGETLLKMIKKI